MHRVILNTPMGMDTDHINGNGLDNRRCNLRICTHAENISNQRKYSNTMLSKFKGVSWDKSRNRWIVYIGVHPKRIFLGRFKTEIDAAIAYDNAARKYFGEFACTNSDVKEVI